jgi:hypothetical protein
MKGHLLAAVAAASISLAGPQKPLPVNPPSVQPPTVQPPVPPQTIPPRAPTSPSPTPLQGSMRLSSVGGVIVDSADGRPIARAVVRLVGRGVFLTRLSDEKGHVLFTDVPPGDFLINAQKVGFFDGAYGKRRPGGAGLPLTMMGGLPITDLRIELFRSGVISGFVFDENNDPVIGAEVVALRRLFDAGQWRFTAVGTQTTDDQGNYRIFGLMPGDYIVSVPAVQVTAPIASFEAIATNGSVGRDFSSFYFTYFAPRGGSGGGTEGLESRLVYDPDGKYVMMPSAATPPPGTGPRQLAYPTKYFPAADAIAAAVPVALRPGEDHRGVNFSLRPVPTARIQGRVIGPEGAVANQQLRLLPMDSDDFGAGTETAATVSAPDGTFTFLRVPSGRYTIEAEGVGSVPAGPPALIDSSSERPGLWGRTPVGIDDADVDSVVVHMEPSLTVRGSLVYEGSIPRPVQSQLEPIEVSVSLASGAPGPRHEARLDPGGRFTLRGLRPGEYVVRISSTPSGWFVKSVTVAGRDVSDTPLIVSSTSEPIVTITLTDRATELMGTVRDARNLPVAGATVIAIPAGSAPNALHPVRMREVRSSRLGVFYIAGLPPGDYLVVALDDSVAEGWQDQARIAELRTQATRLSLRDAEQRSVELRVAVRR